MYKDYYSSHFTEKSYEIDNKKYYRFIVSNSHIDRTGDSINVYGIDLEEYNRNPIVLYNHNSDKIIGNSKLSVEDGILYGDVWFDEVHEISRQTKQQIDLGTLKTASIGLEVFETSTRELNDLEKSKNKRNWIKKVRTIDKSNIFEWSIVPLPANTEAERKRIEFKNNMENKMENEIVEKAGAKISKKNLELLKIALDSIQAVISDMENNGENTDTELENALATKQIEIDEMLVKIASLENANLELTEKLQPRKISLNEFITNKETENV